MALNSLLCADVLLRNCSLTHSTVSYAVGLYCSKCICKFMFVYVWLSDCWLASHVYIAVYS